MIDSARSVALSILKPSEKDLQHGLELHRNSLVAESYSLFLHAPVDADTLNAATDAGASDLEYQDLSEGMRMTGWARSEQLRADYREIWEASGVNCMFLNAGEEGNQPLQLIKRLARYIYLIDQMPDTHGKATTVAGIEALWKSGKYALCLSGNGIPLTGNQYSVEDELRYLPVFHQLGIRMMHLTYNRRNLIGDGCGESANGGLSDFGKTVVQEMNRLGIIIDLAHSGWQTTIDTARTSDKPVVISHSAVWELNNHIRCKSDEVIKAVVDGGGTIGITNVPRFLGGKGNISSLLDHIDYVVRKFGVDAVTIGTDSSFRHPGLTAASLNARPKARKRWDNFWPQGQEVNLNQWTKPEQMASMAWTNWPLFTVGLVQRGYSDADIAKIIGGNLLRVAAAAWA